MNDDGLQAMDRALLTLEALRRLPKGAGMVPCTCELPPSTWPERWPQGMRCAKHRRLVRIWESRQWEGAGLTRF